MASGENRTYIAIDLKSFYASVECHERNLDPLTTNLVVADKSRTSKTICLAVTPSLKAYGLSGRSRLFEVEAKAAEIKRQTGKELEYIVAVPRMALYIQYSAKIYEIYLKYFSHDDIHVYSIDEVFIDATGYLNLYGMTARELASKVITHILNETGITATAGIAPNLYLCKIAMDIMAKHCQADRNDVRIAELDEMSYRRELWNHKPLTDFWRIGKGTANRLAKNMMFTMGDVARRALKNEDSLYKIFGIDAEILIDHAFGYEPCTIKDIKSYKSRQKCLGSGQVLQHPYSFEKARIVVREMAELLALDLFEKNLVSDSVILMVGYDVESLKVAGFSGETVDDGWGRLIPKPAHGIAHLGGETNSSQIIVDSIMELFDRIVNKEYLVRRLNISAAEVIPLERKQPGLFTESEMDGRETNLQQARIDIMKKYGKSAIIKGTDLEDGATTLERNRQIGGHRA